MACGKVAVVGEPPFGVYVNGPATENPGPVAAGWLVTVIAADAVTVTGFVAD